MTPTVTSTISAARTNPAGCVAAPGLPSSCAIAMGKVVEPDRDRNEVAPNSPRDIAIDRPVARNSAGFSSGNSMWRHVVNGDAPSVAEALRREAGIALTAGSNARITSGRAMTAWMTGMNQRSDLQEIGDLLKVMMRPIPRVAAEIASGNENSARGADVVATNKASGTQIQAAVIANTSEVVTTDWGETESAGKVPEKIVRHADSENWPLTTSDLYRVPTRGVATMTTANAEIISGVVRCLGFV